MSSIPDFEFLLDTIKNGLVAGRSRSIKRDSNTYENAFNALSQVREYLSEAAEGNLLKLLESEIIQKNVSQDQDDWRWKQGFISGLHRAHAIVSTAASRQEDGK